MELRKGFRENPDFDQIFNFLEMDKPKPTDKIVADILAKRGCRSDFAAFLDDVAMCVNSGVIRLDVANYSFGYYARLLFPIRADYQYAADSNEKFEWAKRKSEIFWKDLEDDCYWGLLELFAANSRKEDQKLRDKHTRYKSLTELLKFRIWPSRAPTLAPMEELLPSGQKNEPAPHRA